MKKILLVLLVLALTTAVLAVPYASRIRVSSTAISVGSGLTITYIINEAGGAATIYIIKVSDISVVATFSGTATRGLNTVVWNGKVDNASGAAVPAGDYRVKITVSKTAASAWAEISSNHSLTNLLAAGEPDTTYNTLFIDGYSPNEILIAKNPEQASFGLVLSPTSYTGTNPRYGLVVLNPDLSCYDGADGLATWLNFPGTPTTPNGAFWGSCFDPDDPETVWGCGQSVESNVFNGKYNDTTAVDATNGNTNVANSRDIGVVKQGADKYAYVAQGLATIWKIKIISGNKLDTTSVNILGLADTTRYSKNINFDSNGNLYWTSRYTDSASGNGGAVYRWSKAQIEAASAGSLTEANAQWNIQLAGSNGGGVAITPNGDVYARVLNEDPGNDGSLRGIYFCGNTATASIVKTLTSADRIWAFFGTVYTGQVYSIYTSVESDIAGNIYFGDRSREQIRVIGPGGTTSVPIVAPTSQNFNITAVGALGAKNWNIYE